MNAVMIRQQATIFKKIVGLLSYLCNSRSDISYIIIIISRLLNEPRKPRLVVAKRILRYIEGTMKCGIIFIYVKKKKSQLVGYSDSNRCRNITVRIGTLWYVFKYNDATISCCTKKKCVTILSSCKVEYIVAH